LRPEESTTFLDFEKDSYNRQIWTFCINLIVVLMMSKKVRRAVSKHEHFFLFKWILLGIKKSVIFAQV
jgi:hypothetical protein